MATDSRTLGRRVAEARLRAGLTQDQLASAISLGRSDLAKIEGGSRRLSALELAKVAETLGARIESFIEDTPSAIVSHRNVTDPGEPSPTIDALIETRLRAVEFVVAHDGQFHDLMREPEVSDLPNSAEAAEELAGRARSLLEIDQGEPIHHLATKMVRAGVVTFVVGLGRDSADAASVLLSTGAVAIVNGDRRVGRRRLSLAHELGHILVQDEYTIDWRTDGSANSGQREAALDRFARTLLLPASSLSAEWLRVGGGDDIRTAAVRTASHFRVDMSTLARRLFELGLIDGSQATQVRSARTTKYDITVYDLVVGEELISGKLPREYERAVFRLYESEVISDVRALELLFGSWEAADLPKLPQLPEDAVWQFIS